MKSGLAPTTTMSSTTMPTRSSPIVSCLSIACAIATFVPTPSVLVASRGLRVRAERGGVEQPGEAADAAEDLGAVGAAHRGLHQLDREVAGGRVDPGFGIGVHGGVAGGRGHASSLPAARACADAGPELPARRGLGPREIGTSASERRRLRSRMAAWAARGLRSG